jgi:protein Tex
MQLEPSPLKPQGVANLVPTNSVGFEEWFKKRYPGIPMKGAHVVFGLVADGGTVPFIARYRKDVTGNLDEVAVARCIEAQEMWDALVKRKVFVLKEIEDQGKLTPELQLLIQQCVEPARLEDYYLPYKRKRKTKAVVAREAGLDPLASWIWDVGHGLIPDLSLAEYATKFIDADKGIKELQEALDGARHIIIERLAEDATLRQRVREDVFTNGGIVATPGEKKDEEGKFDQYLNYEESVTSLKKASSSHRYLAVRRGEGEKILTLKVGAISSDPTLEERLMDYFQQSAAVEGIHPEFKDFLAKAARFALKLHVLPSIEAEVHRTLKDSADEVAIEVFAENVRKVMLSAPLGPKTVLGVDPGIRTGCKLALIDESGKLMAHSVVHIEKPAEREKSLEMLKKIAAEHSLHAIAIGNGTGGREAESYFRSLVKELGILTHVVVVNEAGASVYSASAVAREEFPNLDLTVRGTISIARRLQDPLAELVKIDPKSIGVGQYQHDVSQSGLKKSLERVVESSVNAIGVNLNTASEHLLAYVAGVGSSLAKHIVKFRGENGLFTSREDLKKVPRFSSKVFEQAAGFLRVPEGANPLDNTGVHPESYSSLLTYAESQGSNIEDFIGAGAQKLRQATPLQESIGALALDDIIKELEKPGRDPRSNFVPFTFKEGVQEVKDLVVGMKCPGIVTNVTNFGAFVDVGVHQDGLVHISQLSDNFIKDPQEVVSPGDRVVVTVTEVDVARKRIALSMKSDAGQEASAARAAGGTHRVEAQRTPQQQQASGAQRTSHRSAQQGQGTNASAGGGNRRPSTTNSSRGDAAGQSKNSPRYKGSATGSQGSKDSRSHQSSRSQNSSNNERNKTHKKQEESFGNTPFAALKNLGIKLS